MPPMAKKRQGGQPKPGKRHTPKAKAPERRKPFKYVRVREPAASLAEEAARAKLGKLSAWVTEAVIEKLERLDRWPPKPPPPPPTPS